MTRASVVQSQSDVFQFVSQHTVTKINIMSVITHMNHILKELVAEARREYERNIGECVYVYRTPDMLSADHLLFFS